MKHHIAATRILLLFFVSAVLSLSACSGQKEQEGLEARAWDFMVRNVSTKLGKTKNLTFPPDGAGNVTPLGENRFQITSFAEFTNAQGQQETAYFNGTVVYNKETWTLESLKFAE
ncbi:MAG: hypothetical protein ACYC9M_15635 [Desulfobulbaceae bacterium]